MYGSNRADAVSASAYIESEIVTISGANTGYCVAPFRSKVVSVSYIITTATTVDPSAITVADGDGNAIGTFSIPVKSVNTGAVGADALQFDADAVIAPGEVVSLTSDGGSTAGAAKFIVQFQAI